MTNPPNTDFLWAHEQPGAAPIVMDCPNCGAPGAKPLICLSPPGITPVWHFLSCPACGAGFYADQTIADYGEEGMSAASTTYFLQQGAALGIFADILAHIRKGPGARYVEVGCGFGFGLDAATHAMGWTARGMDPAALSEVGRQMLGLDITPAYFDPTTVADGSCDVVMATEVLEHLPDPLGFLRDIRRGLAADGIAVLTTPDLAAVRPAIAKPVLQATLTVGLHLILQSKDSLTALLRRAGFAHVRVTSDGWKLTAFASDQPLDLEEDAARRQARVIGYLTERALSRPEPDDLFIGFAGRAFFEAVCAQDWPAAARIWERLGPSLQSRYGIDIDTISTALLPRQPAGLEDVARRLPFNLAVIMLARAYQRLAQGEARAGFSPRFAAIGTVCGPLWTWLETMQISDMQTRQILWVAQAEQTLCLAAGGRHAALGAVAALAESPTGVGRADIVARACEFLIHAERPYCAARLARNEGASHVTASYNITQVGMVQAFAREGFYRLRQRLRG
ncbi:class I SAM-dependent methyltransferase [Acidisoma sp. 7E03]